MPEDIYAPKGATSGSKPDAGKANLRAVPVFAIVKDNIDPTRAGRLQVYIDDIGGSDPDNADSWITVSYLPPFYGYTDASGGTTGYGSLEANPSSYGMWYSPPDIGTKVICIFINGDPNYGFYIGAVPKPEALRMVPAIGANFIKEEVTFNKSEAQSYGGATRLPVANMNTNNSNLANSPEYLLAPKPVHSYTAAAMNQQGIIRDPIRGPISTSSQRESPSRVGWGVSTPGRPIYEGGYSDDSIADAASQGTQPGLKVVGRRGGHTFVMDDGDIIGNDQLIRLRSSLGHQILLSDNGQTLSILHANGQSYIELGKEGTIDLFSTNSVNVRTQGDLNLHADNDININAKKNLNIFAEQINVESTKDYNQKIGTNNSIYTMGKYTHKVDGAMSLASDGDASFASTATTFINGDSRINLNTGSTSTTPETVSSLKQIAQTDTLFDSDKGFIAAPGKLLTIASRAPAHYPWANAGQGVDVKTSLDASAEFPSSPNDAVASANENAGPVDPEQAVTPAGIATVPPVSAVSSTLDKGTTGALVSAAAQTAATGPAAAAVQAGAGIVTDAKGKLTAAVGTTGLNPKQLEQSGILKPGSATTVNGLIQQGANLATAMTSNMFTGKDGAKDLPSLVNNVQAQANATVNLMQKSQTALTNAGAMTGKEGAGAVAGMVLAGATQGVGATLDAVKNAGTNIAGAAAGAAGAASDAVNKAMGAGNFAANMSQNGLNGLAGISASATKTFAGLAETAKGVAASAFNAIKSSFKPFEAGKPQDLGAIAAANKGGGGLAGAVGAIAGVAGTALSGAVSGLTQAAGGLTSGVGSLSKLSTSTLSGGIGSAIGDVSKLATNAAAGVINGVKTAAAGLTGGASALSKSLSTTQTTAVSTAGAIASGVSNLPGGQNAVSAVTNMAAGAVNSIPGTGLAKNMIDNATTAVNNGISSGAAAIAGLSSGTSVSALAGGAVQNAQNAVQGEIGSLTDKLQSQGQGLAALAASGLPADAAAQLQSQIAAISSVGESKIGLPAVATNTTDRSSLIAKTAALLGNSKIPAPNYSGEISSASLSSLKQQADAINEKNKKVVEISKQLREYRKELEVAKINFEMAKQNNPEGAPEIEAAKQELAAIYQKGEGLYDQLRALG